MIPKWPWRCPPPAECARSGQAAIYPVLRSLGPGVPGDLSVLGLERAILIRVALMNMPALLTMSEKAAAGPDPAVFECARALTAVLNGRGNTDGLLYTVNFALSARIAMPFGLRDWAEADLGVSGTSLETRRGHVLGAKWNKTGGFLVFPCHGASAVCSAELVCREAPKSRNFLYVHVGYFACGGLVITNALCTGRVGNAAVLASIRSGRTNSDLAFSNLIC